MYFIHMIELVKIDMSSHVNLCKYYGMVVMVVDEGIENSGTFWLWDMSTLLLDRMVMVSETVGGRIKDGDIKTEEIHGVHSS